jgi:hypothetical protein
MQRVNKVVVETTAIMNSQTTANGIDKIKGMFSGAFNKV